MLTIQDLLDRFEIQGAYKVVAYNGETDEATIVAEGYELKSFEIEDRYADAEISYMYAEDNVLVIEINLD